MPRRIAAFIGPSPSDLHPVSASDGKWHYISTPRYQGRLAKHMKGLVDPDGYVPKSPYFASERCKKGVTWSFQAEGEISVLSTALFLFYLDSFAFAFGHGLETI